MRGHRLLVATAVALMLAGCASGSRSGDAVSRSSDIEGFRAQMSATIEGVEPAGTTVEGLILTSDLPEPRTSLVSTNGTVEAELDGAALSVGWNGASILRPDGSLSVIEASLGGRIPVGKPSAGVWVSVGAPVVPAISPPVRTGQDDYLLMLADGADKGPVGAGDLVVVDVAGRATAIHELSPGHAWRPGPAPVTG